MANKTPDLPWHGLCIINISIVTNLIPIEINYTVLVLRPNTIIDAFCIQSTNEERNESGIHWDIVKDLRERAGGGKIFVDDELVQENGEWVY